MEDNGSLTLLIFQAPGINEWANGRPIISTAPTSAGSRLERAFRKLGKTRQDFNITNTVQCFPGKKIVRNGVSPRDKPPSALARHHCANWLLQDIGAQEFSRVVVFGLHARRPPILSST
jgi:uracil-DNA glycosylase family 4